MVIVGVGTVFIGWFLISLLALNASKGVSGQMAHAYIWILKRGYYAFIAYLVYAFGIVELITDLLLWLRGMIPV